MIHGTKRCNTTFFLYMIQRFPAQICSRTQTIIQLYLPIIIPLPRPIQNIVFVQTESISIEKHKILFIIARNKPLTEGFSTTWTYRSFFSVSHSSLVPTGSASSKSMTMLGLSVAHGFPSHGFCDAAGCSSHSDVEVSGSHLILLAPEGANELLSFESMESGRFFQSLASQNALLGWRQSESTKGLFRLLHFRIRSSRPRWLLLYYTRCQIYMERQNNRNSNI